MLADIFKAKQFSLRERIFFTFIALILVLLIIPYLWGKDNVMPRTYLGNIKISGSLAKAQEQINENISFFEQKPLLITFQNKKINTSFLDIGLNINEEKTASSYLNGFRAGSSFFSFSFRWWENLIWGYNIPVYYTIDMRRLENLIGQKFDTVLTPVQEASIKLENEKVNLIPAKEGVGINSTIVVAKILKNLKEWKVSEVDIKLRKVIPEISNEEAKKMQQELEELLSYPFAFKALGYTFHVSRPKLLSWVEIQKVQNQGGLTMETGEDLNVIVNTILTGKSYSDSKKGYHLEWIPKKEEIAQYI